MEKQEPGTAKSKAERLSWGRESGTVKGEFRKN